MYTTNVYQYPDTVKSARRTNKGQLGSAILTTSSGPGSVMLIAGHGTYCYLTTINSILLSLHRYYSGGRYLTPENAPHQEDITKNRLGCKKAHGKEEARWKKLQNIKNLTHMRLHGSTKANISKKRKRIGCLEKQNVQSVIQGR